MMKMMMTTTTTTIMMKASFPVWSLFLCISLFGKFVESSTWSEWWTYEGISGPDFWGLVNPEWSLCSKGRRQSPVNIDSKLLLFDPQLTPLRMDKHKVSGVLTNTGHDVRLIIDEPGPNYINITGGPLSYQYRASEILFHFGIGDKHGSEHSIDSATFPAEIQILGYNSDLYGNLTQAQHLSNGLVMITMLSKISGNEVNSEIDIVVQHLKSVRYKGQQIRVRHLSVYGLIPETDDYITYEGSLTQPGCHETVTWVLINRPIYISQEQLSVFRELMQGAADSPKAAIANNCRPTMPVNLRPIRTNINFQNPTKSCTMERQNYYHANIMDMS